MCSSGTCVPHAALFRPHLRRMFTRDSGLLELPLAFPSTGWMVHISAPLRGDVTQQISIGTGRWRSTRTAAELPKDGTKHDEDGKMYDQ